MLKLKADLSDLNLDDFVEGVKSRFKSAVAVTVAQAKEDADKLASSKLKGGLEKWRNGFKVHRISDDMYLISIEGQLANWMEDGIQVGEISKAIMHGNRAESNKAEGKNYVDVPITKDADAAGNISLGKSGTKLNVKAFASADALTKYMSSSDWKNGGIKKEKIVQQRIKDVLKVTKTEGKSPSYMTIRRVTPSSVWPSSPFSGAKVLDDLDRLINDNFEQILQRFL